MTFAYFFTRSGKKTAALASAALLLSILAGCGSQGGGLDQLEDEQLAAQADEAARAFFEEEEPVGLSVGILRDGQAAFFNYGAKSEGGEAITENTQFEIASVSKTMAGILLGTLDADSDAPIAADAPVQLPDVDLPDYEGEQIQWWHLSAHVSGLPRLPDNFEDGQNPYADYTADDLRYYLTEQAHLYTSPGENYLYSNLGVGLLGYAMSCAMETPYEQLLQERVWNVLGMGDTAISLTAEQEKARAMPHTRLGTSVSQWDFDVLAACGGVKSTTSDLLIYLAANMGQVSVTDETLAQGMEKAQQVWFDDGTTRIGLGFLHGRAGGKEMLWHNGATGGYRSFIGFVPETGTGVAVLCNSAIDVDDVAVRILELLQQT